MTLRRILIADRDARWTSQLARYAHRMGYVVQTAQRPDEVLRIGARFQADVLCLEAALFELPCAAAARLATRAPHMTNLPIVLLVNELTDQVIRRAITLGAVYMTKCRHARRNLKRIISRLLNPGPPFKDTKAGASLPQDSQQQNNLHPAKMALLNHRMLTAVGTLLADRTPTDSVRAKASTAPAQLGSPRVLCIDDDADYVRAIELRLRSHGFSVSRAANGLDGYCCALAEPADAILLDFHLPSGPGDYVLDQLKNNPATRDIPVIVVSGRRDAELPRTLVNSGATRFLSKPLDFDDLLSELRKVLPTERSPCFK